MASKGDKTAFVLINLFWNLFQFFCPSVSNSISITIGSILKDLATMVPNLDAAGLDLLRVSNILCNKFDIVDRRPFHK